MLPWPLKWGSTGPTVVHALRKCLASFTAGDVIFAAVVIFRCSGYTRVSLWWLVSYCCRGQSIQGNAGTFSEQVIASIIFDSRCGMSGIVFRTAPRTGGPSCFIFLVTCDLTLWRSCSITYPSRMALGIAVTTWNNKNKSPKTEYYNTTSICMYSYVSLFLSHQKWLLRCPQPAALPSLCRPKPWGKGITVLHFSNERLVLEE